jgi:hypothetical protein
MADLSTLSYEELRSLVLESLPDEGQLANLYPVVAQAFDRRYPAQPPGPSQQFGVRVVGYFDPNVQHGLQPRDRGRIQDVFWDLLIERVLHVGLGDGMNNDLPFFHKSEYGKQVTSGQKPSPHDQDGFLRRITSITPTVDGVTLEYLTEALRTFRVGCLLSSTITLGCAAERIALNLMEALVDALNRAQLPHEAKKLEKTADDPIMQRKKPFDDLMSRIVRPKLRAVDRKLEGDLTVLFESISHDIRRARNEAGHPTGISVDRDDLYAHMMQFVSLVRTSQALLGWIQQDPSPLL